jgi:hypothetical protein
MAMGKLAFSLEHSAVPTVSLATSTDHPSPPSGSDLGDESEKDNNESDKENGPADKVSSIAVMKLMI